MDLITVYLPDSELVYMFYLRSFGGTSADIAGPGGPADLAEKNMFNKMQPYCDNIN